jgi:hypothetical protein
LNEAIEWARENKEALERKWEELHEPNRSHV